MYRAVHELSWKLDLISKIILVFFRTKIQEGIEKLRNVVLGGGTYLSGGLRAVSAQAYSMCHLRVASM